MFRKTVSLLMAALTAALIFSGCALSKSVDRRQRIDELSRSFELELGKAVFITEDDQREFQGWGYYYAELDMSAAPPDFAKSEHWRSLPFTFDLSAFLKAEGDQKGRHPFSPPANGYWFFKSMKKDGEYGYFLYPDSLGKVYYYAAFYDSETEVLTLISRTKY